jgi:hypothetical protein
MAAHIKGLSASGHMVTTSVADAASFGDIFDLDVLDFAQAHLYMPRWSLAEDATELDEIALLSDYPRRTESGKPWLIAEFGYAPEKPLSPAEKTPRAPSRNAADSEGILLQNALWCSLAAGRGSSAMFWWWDDYIERHKLWKRFGGPSAFARRLASLRQPSVGLRDDGRSELRLIGHRTPDTAAFWIHERRATAMRQLEKGGEYPIRRGVRVRLPSMAPGKYKIYWFGAMTTGKDDSGPAAGDAPGMPEREETFAHPGEEMDIAVPDFRGCIGAIIDGR